MKGIQDYIHLYFGADCMEAIIVPDQEPEFERSHINIRTCFNLERGLSLVKPILRPLSSMTQQEADEYNKLYGTLFNMADMINQVMQSASSIKYLLSRHFDLFNLIPEGLAIDSTTLTPQP